MCIRDRYQQSLKSLEAKLAVLEESRNVAERKHEDALREWGARERSLSEKGIACEAELEQARAELHAMKEELQATRLSLEKTRSDLALKEDVVQKLESENSELQSFLKYKRELSNDQLQSIIEDHDHEKDQWMGQKMDLEKKLESKDQMCRGLQMELNKARYDYQRLAELLQSNVSKAIYNCFAENSYIGSA
eukprot:TRINITY_DN9041_c0_g1_i2.p2 TRINITY_DN9041_c0_g1~~TRINITY_DN9041_c0_g1_i2.p2  ORF type:complete len:192 (+),score=46.71 TRINITY_DN9041_c0_g1_i2:64-639(+)